MSRIEKKYRVSFIVPVYNAEEYLHETIESLLDQTIGFKENCELILVNDGSTDGSEVVCLRYKDLYPDNVRYIKQENSGPGAARNAGITVAKGEYISMPDADDKLSSDTAEEACRFLDKHKDEIDCVGLKWEFFEARTGTDHPLNYRFTSDRVVDLTKDFDMIQGSVAPAVFRADALKRYSFDPAVGRWSEDMRFMGEFLLDNPKYGIITKPTYYYRKRDSKTSSQDINRKSKFWYLETLKRVHLDLLSLAKKRGDGSIPRFIQYMVAYDIKFRFKSQVDPPLDKQEMVTYKKIIRDILQQIDDDIIFNQKHIHIEFRLFMLSVKYDKNIFDIAKKDGWQYKLGDMVVYDAKKQKPVVKVQLASMDGEYITIEGNITRFLFKDAKFEFRTSKKSYDIERTRQPHIEVKSLGEVIYDRNSFKVKIPLKDAKFIRAYLVHGKDDIHLNIDATSTSRLSNRGFSYRRTGGYMVKLLKSEFIVQNYSIPTHIKAEARRLVGMLRQRDYRNIVYRLAYFAAKPFFRKPIWIVLDRIQYADDNGEIFFEYLNKQAPKNQNVYFAISKDSPDYERLKSYGKVLTYYSFKHKLLYLLSSKVISSEASDFVHNLFNRNLRGVMDLYDFDFVFLQHGIIRDDISGWLYRHKKDIKLFTTTAGPEYQSILDGHYDYDESVVKLTGLLRYDKLQNNPQNKLIIAPTWRKNISTDVDPVTGKRPKIENFTETDYYKFYQGLIDDSRLRSALKERGMIGQFYLHPSFATNIEDFKGNESFRIMKFPHDYPKAKSEGNIMVTDYSSVAFDFAYLKKPVIYSQYDVDTFYQDHVSDEGYLSYEKEGLGAVVYNKESTVDEIIRTIKNDCKMPVKYQKRVDKFFAWQDRNNCKRVYEAILELDRQKKA